MAYTTIKKPSDYFNIILYTADGTAGQSQTGVGFEPDMVWVKSRNAGNYHGIADQLRGVGKFIYPNDSAAEQTNLTDYLTSFDSDGFTHGLNGTIGQNSVNYAAWNWKANGTGVANTDGSISSTVSANTTSGFSISTWNEISSSSAQTIGHGLGVAPDMMIMKRRNDGGSSWLVYHKSIGNTGAQFLDGTASTSTSSSYWNNTSPTSSVFTLGAGWNASASYNWVSYNFAEKQGYSKFGSYTGNGNADGTFIYTGFKPAWLMIKRTDTAGDRWVVLDSKRDTFNVSNKAVYADDSQAENPVTSEQGLDILSNGFKIRNSNTKTNSSGASYIYMAFAEQPLVGDNPATAR